MMLALLLLLIWTPTVEAETPVWELVKNARRDSPDIHQLNAAEQHRARRFFHALLQAAESGTIPPRLRGEAAALSLHIRVEPQRVLVWGREASFGLYVVRLGKAKPAILQAPHSFYDLGSGRLTSALYEEGEWRAAYFNTGHRYGGPGLSDEDRPDPAPDVAHSPYSMFQAATIGALDALNQPAIIQIHGFRSREGESAVVTPGASLQPNSIHVTVRNQLTPILAEWGPVLGAAARPNLAGRRNMQGRAVSGHARFIHLELSKSARDGLVTDSEKLSALNGVLQGASP